MRPTTRRATGLLLAVLVGSAALAGCASDGDAAASPATGAATADTATPARGPTAYTGQYHALDRTDLYVVFIEAGGLRARLGPDGDSTPLSHVDGDTFEVDDLGGTAATITFDVETDGRARSVTVEAADGSVTAYTRGD